MSVEQNGVIVQKLDPSPSSSESEESVYGDQEDQKSDQAEKADQNEGKNGELPKPESEQTATGDQDRVPELGLGQNDPEETDKVDLVGAKKVGKTGQPETGKTGIPEAGRVGETSRDRPSTKLVDVRGINIPYAEPGTSTTRGGTKYQSQELDRDVRPKRRLAKKIPVQESTGMTGADGYLGMDTEGGAVGMAYQYESNDHMPVDEELGFRFDGPVLKRKREPAEFPSYVLERERAYIRDRYGGEPMEGSEQGDLKPRSNKGQNTERPDGRPHKERPVAPHSDSPRMKERKHSLEFGEGASRQAPGSSSLVRPSPRAVKQREEERMIV
jgi:hypothetical protein